MRTVRLPIGPKPPIDSTDITGNFGPPNEQAHVAASPPPGADSEISKGSGGYLIGVGRADCTGPIADVSLMGYADSNQKAGGILSRQYCRTFILAERKNNTKRVIYVVAEIAVMSQRIRLEVIKQLKDKYGDLYNHNNVLMTATHTHSGPAGYFQNTLLILTSGGLIKPTLNAIVNGILKSIDTAHQNMVQGHIFMGTGLVENSQINRSPLSYLQNPVSERLRYSSNIDKEMTVLKMVANNGQEIGMFSWFAIHPVSMNNSNILVNSDNVGYAAYLFEQEKNEGYLPGKGPFVAAFASSNLGDVSPNTKGPHCINTGEPCENMGNYCVIGGAKMCIATGPGKDMFQSTQIIGSQIYSSAKEIYMKASKEIDGPISSVHRWVDMSNVTVQLNSTYTGKTCKPALGYSFAAGTIDGPGMFNFTQGTTEGHPFWDAVRDAFLVQPSNESVECHKPKPILLPIGELTKPYLWQSNIIDIQMFTIGSAAIVALPGEFTTMAGRRVREAVKKEFEIQGKAGMDIIISGLCSIYTHYISTYEEYQVQRYEGGSTIFGPHTLSAYIQLFEGLARALATNTTQDLPNIPEPPILNITNLNFLPPIIDAKPLGQTYGDVLQDVQPTYKMGQIAEVHFVGANPRSSTEYMSNFTFLTVEKYDTISKGWQVLHDDASWDTRLIWKKGKVSQSTSIIEWHIPRTTELGKYRIQYFGHSKKLFGSVQAFNGSSSTFEVSN
ncbi:neutral ceramidase [Protobothrops mucrosquamatus]|uniref:neutral ceramidase n=1 Tax=Protobothrops mucrosquamatus TaxID=103944 RepID=UPI000775EA4B|nr:neutral ceramidase [Protobothrops mucrosquamatus]